MSETESEELVALKELINWDGLVSLEGAYPQLCGVLRELYDEAEREAKGWRT